MFEKARESCLSLKKKMLIFITIIIWQTLNVSTNIIKSVENKSLTEYKKLYNSK